MALCEVARLDEHCLAGTKEDAAVNVNVTDEQFETHLCETPNISQG